MDATDPLYKAYIDILHEELVPAMGCTEPIAIAFAAARARQELGVCPDRVAIQVSSNIIKNVKSVVVPNTGNLKGIAAAAAAGIVAGDAGKSLEVIATVSDAQRAEIKTFLAQTTIDISNADTDLIFDIIVTLFHKESKACVRIAHYHTNIVLITKDGETVYQNLNCEEADETALTDRSLLNVKDIISFAGAVDLSLVREVLLRQVDYNMRIAQEGINGNWGANIGTILLETWGDDVKARAKAMAAAGSDARMSGCELPVIIVSGSGNQGITASVPVVVYAREMGVDQDTLLRALVISNLVTVHQKTGIGPLSAYCGAVSAGVGAGAGITFLHGGGLKHISHTIVNALATVSGIICDGAKPACASKIAAAVEAGILGFHMYQKGKQFYAGDGIVTKGVENTIVNIGRLARRGMRETDREIIDMMIGQ